MNIHDKGPQHQYQAPVSRPELDEVCRVLSGILSDGVDVHRCMAARAAGRIGDPASVKPLIAALLDEDEDVRTDAAEALSELADPLSGQQLFENLLGDPCTDVKLAAIETLAKMQDKRIIPWLRRMVKGRDEEIIWDEEEFYSSGWDDWVDIQIKAVKALAEMNAGEAVPDIVAAMQDDEALDMTETALKALARMGKPGIEALDSFLDEDSPRMRRRAAAALASIDAREAAEPLARALADPSAEVRHSAMDALAARAPADSRLAALLEDPDATIRAGAVGHCGTQHPDRLEVMIDDASKSVQVAALKALAGIEGLTADEALVSSLREKLENGAGEVAAASAHALANLAPKVAIDDLISLLGDAARPVTARHGALQGLAAVGGERAMDALADTVDDAERSLRLETMPALARLARADAVWPNVAGDALLFALRGGYAPEAGEETGDQSSETTQELEAEEETRAPARVANNDNDAGAFPTSTLSAILEDTPDVREIVDLPGEGVELTLMDMERLALAKRIKGKKRMQLEPKVVLHEDIRLFAARVLGDLYHAEVAQELADVLNNSDAGLRLAAADSLARIGEHLSPFPDAVTEILMATAVEADRELKLLLIRALAAAGGEAAPVFLAGQLSNQDSFIRTEAVRALTRARRSGPELEALLDDPDPAVRLCAAQAVAGADGDDAIEMLVNFAFSFEGYHGRETARLLREMDATQASALFVDVLQNPEHKRTWSVAIEALEELNCPRPILNAEIPDYERRG